MRIPWANITDITGSAALTTCVNETAICENETHAETCPTVWKNATGISARTKSPVTRGAGCRFVAHKTHINNADAPSWKADKNQGAGKTFNIDLFKILNMILNAYHPRTYAPTRSCLAISTLSALFPSSELDAAPMFPVDAQMLVPR